MQKEIKIPLAEIQFAFARSSGPGGQNVNKVNTKAQLRWSLVKTKSLPDDVRLRLIRLAGKRMTTEGELVIQSQRFRDAGRNVADCMEKLRLLLAEAAIPPTPRKKTKPTRGSIRRRLDDKSQQSKRKQSRGNLNLD